MKPPAPKDYRIVRVEAGTYALVDHQTNEVVRTGNNPKKLSEWALWDDDARFVHFDFDLKLIDEDSLL